MDTQHVAPNEVNPNDAFQEIRKCMQQAEEKTGIRRHFQLQKARYLSKRLIWQYPNVPKYYRQLDAIHKKLHISEKPTVLTVSALVIAFVLMVAMEYWRLIMAQSQDLLYFVAFLAAVIFYGLGARMFNPLLFA